MRYGRIGEGHPWHMLATHYAKPLCYAAMTIVETRSAPPEDGSVCKNCDEALRLKGKEERKTLTQKPAPAEYKPRFRFGDFERGRA